MAPDKYTLLIVDDEPANLQKLRRTFFADYRLLEATSGEEAFELASGNDLDLVITDQRMPRMSGLELLKKILSIKPDVMRIILTGYTEVEDLIEAINEGHVYRYITKPWDPGELRVVVRQALEKLHLERENRRLAEELRRLNERLQAENRVLQDGIRRAVNTDRIVFAGRAMREILESASKVATVDATVLITGETGTGKELLARQIHQSSPRRQGVFVAVNCGAIPGELVESEFFGFRKGAFTGASNHKKGYFQLAEGGTLFLDEVGEAPLDLQVKFLRVLQNREIWPVGAEKPVQVNVRVVASTNRDLQAEVRLGHFREDLFFRLNVFSIRIPPLRERPEDIRPLVEFLLARAEQKLNRRLAGFEEEVFRVFEAYAWPGNVRQLENEVDRLVLLAEDGERVGPDRISPYLRQEAGQPPAMARATGAGPALEDLDVRRHLDGLEISLIRTALQRSDGNRTHAARLLQITRQSLLERMKRCGIQ